MAIEPHPEGAPANVPQGAPTLFQLLFKVGRALVISILATAALFGVLRFVCGIRI